MFQKETGGKGRSSKTDTRRGFIEVKFKREVKKVGSSARSVKEMGNKANQSALRGGE